MLTNTVKVVAKNSKKDQSHICKYTITIVKYPMTEETTVTKNVYIPNATSSPGPHRQIYFSFLYGRARQLISHQQLLKVRRQQWPWPPAPRH